MSDSYRYNPDEDEEFRPRRHQRGKNKGKRRRTDGAAAMAAAMAAADADATTPESMFGKTLALRHHILNRLIQERLLEPCDVGFYDNRLKLVVMEALEGFDPAFITADGKKCSPAHFCLTILERRAVNLRRDLLVISERSARCAPIATLTEDEAKRYGYTVSEESLSDGAKSVSELEFRIDYNELVGRLTEVEAEFLACRMDNYSERDIGEMCGHSRHQVRKVLARVQQKARRMGFFPHCETDGKIDDSSTGYVGEHYGNVCGVKGEKA